MTVSLRGSIENTRLLNLVQDELLEFGVVKMKPRPHGSKAPSVSVGYAF